MTYHQLTDAKIFNESDTWDILESARVIIWEMNLKHDELASVRDITRGLTESLQNQFGIIVEDFHQLV